MASERADHYRKFLAGLILCVLAGTATVWWFTGFFLALAYFSGAATVLVFTKVAPTYHPGNEEDQDRDNPGYQ